MMLCMGGLSTILSIIATFSFLLTTMFICLASFLTKGNWLKVIDCLHPFVSFRPLPLFHILYPHYPPFSDPLSLRTILFPFHSAFSLHLLAAVMMVVGHCCLVSVCTNVWRRYGKWLDS